MNIKHLVIQIETSVGQLMKVFKDIMSKNSENRIKFDKI